MPSMVNFTHRRGALNAQAEFDSPSESHTLSITAPSLWIMLCLPQTTGYAILALSCLAARPEQWLTTTSIVTWTRIPLPQLSKLLQTLIHSGFIRTKPGKRGGFQLTRPAYEISLLEITRSLGDDDCFSACLLGLETCSDARNCPAHSFWKKQKARIQQTLQELTLQDSTRFELRASLPLTEHGAASPASTPPTDQSSRQ
jgi:Rrf2 family iron-sulfur cluster assembly transcriptional regulator